MMITSCVYAHERIEVDNKDIPEAYIHTYSDDDTIMILKG